MKRLPPLIGRFYWTQQVWGYSLHCRPLDRVASHLFSTRGLELRRDGARSPGWQTLAASVGVELPALVRVSQVHGRAVHGAWVRDRLQSGDTGLEEERWPEADAVVSDDPARAIVVQTADCVPILLADPVTGTVGAVHAGWRGTAARAVCAAVDALAQAGSRPTDLVAAIGPCIGPCCYEVGHELVDAFADLGHARSDLERWFVRSAGQRLRLDLPRANRDLLVEAGLQPDQVHLCGLCTASNLHLLYSFRAEGASTGRMVAAIRRRPDGPVGR
jgi:polyphenol oxidase